MLLDTRSPESFASGHLRGSINVGLDGRFAEYAGDVLRPGEQVVLLGDRGRGAEAKIRLARIGFDSVVGEVADIESALYAHPQLATAASRLTATEVESWIAEAADLQLVDVRNPGEVEAGAIPGRGELPASPAPRRAGRARPGPPDRRVLRRRLSLGGRRVHVARAHGFATVADLIGGYDAWVAAHAAAGATV